MSNIDKRALREAAEKATPGPWGIARNGKTITSNQSHPVAVITEDFHRLLDNGKTGGDAEFIASANPTTVLALLDELEAKDRRNAELNSMLERWAVDRAQSASELDDAEKRITELEASHSNLREAMAGIHNTITGGGAYTPLSAILNASKRAYDESAAAAGKGEAS